MLRTVLSHLSAPHRLDTPQIRALLAHHRRLPHTLSPTSVGAAAAQLLRDKIAALEAPPDAPARQRLPHLVLDACFVRGRKYYQAAVELGLSERQLTRERARALQLLADELAAPAAATLSAEPIPSVNGHIRRDPLLRQLSEAVSTERLVAVVGEPGAGKMSLVAALAHALGPENVWWQRIRPRVNDTLQAVLIELGHHLAREGSSELRDYLVADVDVDLGAATRLALQGLGGCRRLIVIDDFDRSGEAEPIAGWVEEVVARVPLVAVVTIGAGLRDAVIVEVPALSRAESAALVGERGLSYPGHILDALHDLSGGNIRMLAAVAGWWSGEQRGLHALERHLEGRGALGNLADLTAFARPGPPPKAPKSAA